MNLYLLVMMGQGDVHTKLVTKAVWDWIMLNETPGRKNGESGWDDTATPESVQIALKAERKNYDGGLAGGLAEVTSGSFQNDRALAASGTEVPVDDYGDSSGPEDARKWAKKNGHKIVDEWEGCIY